MRGKRNTESGIRESYRIANIPRPSGCQVVSILNRRIWLLGVAAAATVVLSSSIPHTKKHSRFKEKLFFPTVVFEFSNSLLFLLGRPPVTGAILFPATNIRQARISLGRFHQKSEKLRPCMIVRNHHSKINGPLRAFQNIFASSRCVKE